MFGLLTRVLRALLSVLAARGSREAEILVLRQQLLLLMSVPKNLIRGDGPFEP
jgi:hypothetical protein